MMCKKFIKNNIKNLLYYRGSNNCVHCVSDT